MILTKDSYSDLYIYLFILRILSLKMIKNQTFTIEIIYLPCLHFHHHLCRYNILPSSVSSYLLMKYFTFSLWDDDDDDENDHDNNDKFIMIPPNPCY